MRARGRAGAADAARVGGRDRRARCRVGAAAAGVLLCAGVLAPVPGLGGGLLGAPAAEAAAAVAPVATAVAGTTNGADGGAPAAAVGTPVADAPAAAAAQDGPDAAAVAASTSSGANPDAGGLGVVGADAVAAAQDGGTAGAAAAAAVSAASQAAQQQDGARAANSTNSQPAFTPPTGKTAFSFTLAPGTDGRLNPAAVGTATATDADSDASLAFSLLPSDSAATVYMIGYPGATANATLYKVSATAGTAARIGSASTGTGRSKLAGTAWHLGRLYAVAPSTDAQPGLHVIDIADGTAARVASSTQLGLGSTASLAGLASHNGALYATTSDSGSGHVGLWRIDLSAATPTATKIGASGMGASIAQPAALASHNGTLYLADIVASPANARLATVNPATGAATVVNASTTSFGVSETAPGGMVSHNGALYLTGSANDALYTLNTSTGAATRVASSVTGFGATPALTAAAGLAGGYAQPEGFAIGAGTGSVSYRGVPVEAGAYTVWARVSDGLSGTGTADTAIDDTVRVTVTVANSAPAFSEDSYGFNVLPAANGSSTAITVGTAQAADPDHADRLAYSLRPSDPANTLYMVDRSTDALFKLNKTTAAATRVGNATRFGVNMTGPRDTAWHNGVLYLVGRVGTGDDNNVYALDPVTGSAAFVADLNEAGLTNASVSITGIASIDGSLYMSDAGAYRVQKYDAHTGVASSVTNSLFPSGIRQMVGIAYHGSKLYVLDDISHKLYEVNTTTSVATAVGSATNFGLSLTDPSGLYSDGTNLYMTDSGTDRLYTLSTTTGIATAVGSTFGSTASQPHGLAGPYVKPSVVSIDAGTGAISYSGTATNSTYGNGWTVYAQVSDGLDSNNHPDTAVDDYAPVTVSVQNTPAAFGQRSYELYLPPGTNGSSNSYTVGRTAAADPDTADTLTYSLRASDASTVVYMIGQSTDALYRLDSSNFNQNAVRVNSAVSKFGVNEEGTALTWHNGKLYMLGETQDALYRLDSRTGVATRVGDPDNYPVAFGVGETFPSGLASHGGVLYMVGEQTDALYRLNPSTGVATRIGNADNFGPNSSDRRQRSARGIASVGGTLYLIGFNPQRLSTLNVSDGVATHVGNVNMGLSNPLPTALGAHAGVLYSFSASVGLDLFSVTTAGVGTAITTPSGFGVGETAVRGIATGYGLPADFAVQSDGDIEYSGSAATGGDEFTLYARVHDGKQGNNTADTTTIDDTVPVTVKVQNQSPSFARDDYQMFLKAGATSHTLGTVTATDPENNTLAYSLRASGDANTLYMVGQQHDALYSMNKTTGAVTRIGSATDFGVGLNAVNGITWHRGRVYLTGTRTAGNFVDGLYAVDISTGAATLVARMRDFGLSGQAFGTLSGVASHDGHLYVANTLGTKPLLKIDLEAGTIVAFGPSGFGVGETLPGGLVSHGSVPKLYMVGSVTGKLYTIDTVTGAATQVGTQNAGFGTSPAEGVPVGLASDGSSLYMVGGTNNQLYTLDTTTGAATAVGSSFGSTENSPRGLTALYVKPTGFDVGASTAAVSYSHTSGVSAGDRYTLYLQANDGKSPAGGSSTAIDTEVPVRVRVVDAAAPAGPDRPGVAATSGAGGSLAVDWEAPFDYAAAVQQYDVRYRARSGGPAQPWSDWAHSGTGTSASLHQGLSAGAEYEVQVRARNGVGAGAWSNSGYATTGAATKPPKPPAPTVRAGNNRIYVSWPALADGGSPFTGTESLNVRYQNTSTAVTTSRALRATLTSVTLSGPNVQNGQTYRVRLQAYNSLGGSPVSDWSVNVTPAVTVPEAPTGLAATVPDGDHGRITLNWTAPSDNGGSAVTDYDVAYRRRLAGSLAAWGAWTAPSAVGGVSTGARVSDLLGAYEYQFRVRARNDNGDSAWGYEAAGAEPTSPTSAAPGAPSVAVAAVSGTGSKLTVTLSGAAANGATITDYDIGYRACTANCTGNSPTWATTWTDRPGETAADTGLTVTLTGLTGGTKYQVRARAANSEGEGAWSSGTAQTTNAAVAPGRPTDFRVNSAHQSAVVTWVPPADDGGAAITKYVVTVTPDGGSAYTVDVTAPATGTTVGSLTNGTTYRIKAAAHNSVGTGSTAPELPANGIPVTPSTTAPGAPTGVTAAAGNAKLTVGWTAPSYTGGLAISSYKAYYRAAGTSTWLTPSNANTTCDTTSGTSTSCDISSLTNGTQYDVTVRAVNSDGDGEWSAVASGTPGKPDTPADLTVSFGTTTATKGTATLSASIGANGGSSITTWQYQRATGADTAFGTTWTDVSSSASNTLSTTVTGHTAGTVYKFRVRAKSSIGTGDASNAVTVTAPTNLPPVFGTVASPVTSFAFDLAAGATGSVGTPAPVGTAAAADPDASDTLTWGLQDSPNGTMYLLHNPTGAAGKALYRVDAATGAATRVGSAANFGQGTTALQVWDMTWHLGRLLMVATSGTGGSASGVLYELDPDTGTATEVGSSVSDFGVSETAPHGIASHGGVLYMIGRDTDKLYSLDPITSAATQVGSATDFGDTGGADKRAGLASHGGTLYTLNFSSAWLESLATSGGTAGQAARVGSQVNFGTGAVGPPNYTGEDGAVGLVSFGATAKLYMVGRRHDRLYTLATSGANAGKATVAASLSSGITDPSGLAGGYAKPAGFAVASGTGAVGWTSSTGAAHGRYRLRVQVRDSKSSAGTADTVWDAVVPVTVDVVNSAPAFAAASYAATLRSGQDGSGGTPVDVVTVSATDAQSADTVSYQLRPSDTHMYMWGTSRRLYELSRSTGQATQIGTFRGVRPDGTSEYAGTLLFGGAWHEGELYVTTDAQKIFRLDPETGVGVLVGAESDLFGAQESHPSGIASHNGDLYVSFAHGTSTNPGKLYRLDVDGRTATQIGSDNFGIGEHGAWSIASHGGKLYMAGAATAKLYELNTTTGAATQVGTQTQFGISESEAYGLASAGGSLYLAGADTDKLYTLATSGANAGKATVVTSAPAGFGVSETGGVALVGGYVAPSDFAIAKVTTGADAGKAKITYTGSSTATGTYGLWAQARDSKSRWGAADTAWDASVLVTVTVNDAPPAPAGLAAAGGDGSVTLSGAAVASGTTLTKWQYAYKTAAQTDYPTTGDGSWTDVAGTAVSFPSTTVTVANGTAYTFKVRAVNGSVDGADSNEATVTLAAKAPPAPTGFAATIAGTTATLSAAIALGQNNSTVMRDSVTKWQYAYKSKPDNGSYGSYGQWVDVTGNTLSGHAITGLTATSLYTFKVQAVNNIGTGAASSELEANAAPVFQFEDGATAYPVAYVTPGANGSGGTPVHVATVSATDANTSHTVTYGLRPSDAATVMYTVDFAGSDSEALYKIDSSTRAVTRVGNVQRFGQSVRIDSTGLAWHNGELYVIGQGRQPGQVAALYTVDSETGGATRVGSLSGFGVGEHLPSGLASHSGALYLIGRTRDTLYTVDPATGQATAVGSGLGGSNKDRAGLASHNGTLYTSNDTDEHLEWINTSTGAAAQVGSASNWGISASDIFGLASHGSTPTLYGVSETASKLYTINTTTGVATELGSIGISWPNGLVSGYVPAAGYAIEKVTTPGKDLGKARIEYSGSSAPAGTVTLYAQASDSKSAMGTPDNVWDATEKVRVRVENRGATFAKGSYTAAMSSRVDRSTTALTVATATAPDPDSDTVSYSLRPSDASTVMYMVGETANALYTLDSSTGLATRVSADVANFGVGECGGARLAWHGGVLYMLGFKPIGTAANCSASNTFVDTLYTLDPRTGVATAFMTDAQLTGHAEWADTLASHDGDLYLLTGGTNPALRKVDLEAKTTVKVGSATAFGVSETAPTGAASLGGVLYMVGASTDALHTLNTTTGVATAVDSTTDKFGISENTPSALASHGGALYLTGDDTDKLYTLSTTTGAATVVDSSATNYGVSEVSNGLASGYSQPADYSVGVSTGVVSYGGSATANTEGVYTVYVQASDGKAPDGTASTAVDDSAAVTVTVTNDAPVFAAGSYAATLASGQDGSGGTPVDVVIVSAADTQPGDSVAYGLRPSDTHMYTLNYTSSDAEALYTVNATSGAATRVGSAKWFGQSARVDATSLAWHQGRLYMVGAAADALYTLDSGTGVATRVGCTSSGGNVTCPAAGFGVSETSPSGLASHGGVLYLVGGANDRLYTLNPATGAATAVGSGLGGSSDRAGLASHGGTLYTTNAGGTYLERINVSTGAATRVGTTDDWGGSETAMSGLASFGSTAKLYAVGASGDKLYTLNTTTGAATDVGSLGIGEPSGLAGGFAAPANYSITKITTGADVGKAKITYTGSSTAVGTYYLWARARDGKDRWGVTDTAWDAAVPVTVTVSDTPPAPTGLAVAGGNGSVTLSGAAVPSGTTVTKWQYAYKTSAQSDYPNTGDGSWTDVTGTAVAMPSVTVTVSNGETYTFKVRAVNGSNDGADSAGVTVTLASAVPGAPTGFTVSVSGTTATLTASVTPNAAVVKWQYAYKSKPAGGSYGSYGDWVDVTGNTLSGHTVSGLTATGVHTFKVRAVNNFGDGAESSEIEANVAPVFVFDAGKTAYEAYVTPGADGSGDPAVDVVTVSATDANSADSVAYRLRPTDSSYTLPAGYAITKVTTGADAGKAKISYTGSSAPAGTVTLHAQARDAKSSTGAADEVWDVSATVTVKVENRPPSFGAASYAWTIPAGTDGSGTPAPLRNADGTAAVATGTDPDGDAVGFYLEDSGAFTSLYMVGDTSDALYKLNRSTGVATRVNSAVTQFGVGEASPNSLAWHHGVLYMIGAYRNGVFTERLYTVNPYTGEAAEFATGTQLGLTQGSDLIGGIASHGGELYIVSASGSAKLRRVDVAARTSTAITATSGFGVSETSPSGLASLGGKLYMVGQSTDALYTLSTSDGTATQVGNATKFGISEGWPADLAAAGTKLYMVGSDTDYLSELSTSTGVATRVGSATGYGASEVAAGLADRYVDTSPTGLAIGASTGAVTWAGPGARLKAGTHGLWVAISDRKAPSGITHRAPDAWAPALVTVTNEPPAFSATAPSLWVRTGSDGSGTAVTAGTVAATDPNGDTLAYRLMPADAATKLYSLADNTGTANDGLWTFTTAGASPASVGAANFGLGSTEVGARHLTWHQGRLYLLGTAADALYEVDPAAGTAARVGTATAFGVSETSPSGLASHGGALYMIGTATDKLYTLNPATGVATAVMSSTSNFGGSTDQDRWSLASAGGKLYTTNCGSDWLEELNAATGVATRVGASTGFGVSEDCARGLAAVGATPTLYMVGASGASAKKLYTLDTSSGAATEVAELTGADDLAAPWGLAGGWTYTTGFQVGAADGVVTWHGSSAPAGTHWLRVQVHDGLDAAGRTSTAWDALAAVAVQVSAGNADPAFGSASYAFGLASGTDGSAGGGATVGTVSASDADASDTVAYGLAGSDPSAMLYLAGRTGDALYRVTPSTGAAVRVGALPTDPWGMAWHGGALYLVAGDTGGSLYRVNPFTGAAVSVASGSTLTGSSGAKLRGLASHGGSLYMTTAAVGANGTGQLWRVTVSADGASATAVLVGDTDGTVGGETENIAEPIALASHGSPAALYLLNRSQLYTVNTSTGALTAATAQSFRATERLMAGMTSHGSPAVLYLTGESGNTLYTVNLTDGTLTALAKPTGGGFGVGELLASGLAGGYVAPSGFAVTASGASAGALRWTGSAAAATAGSRWLYVQARDGRDRAGQTDTAWDATAQVQVSVAAQPGAVSGFSATAGNGSAALAASVATGTAVTGWEYRYKTQPSGGSYGAYGDWTAVPSSASVTLAASVTVANGASYTFQVRAVNLLVAGAASAEAAVTLASAAPPAAADAAASASGTTVTLSASVPASAEPVLRWEYQQDDGSGSGYGAWTAVASSASRTLSHALTGLTASTEYKFKVRAVNNVGNGAASAELTVTTGQPVPPKPTGFTAVGGDGSVTLAASVPSGTTLTGWQYRSKTGGGNYGSWAALGSSAAVSVSASVTAANGATHTFQVRAVNGSHLGTASDEATVTLASAVPGAPSSLSATAGDGSVAVSASAASGTVIYGWEYQLSVNGGAYGSWTEVAGQTGLSVSFTLGSAAGVANGSTYRVKVRAFNNKGDGSAGESATVLMRPAAATDLAATGTGNGTVTLTASISSGATGGSAVTRWEYRYRETTGGTYPGTWTAVASSASNSLSVVVSGLTNSTSYTFVARPVNAVGAAGDSNEVAASPMATVPGAASDLAAAAGQGRATLTASISDTGGSAVTRWEYRYRETTGGTYPGTWTVVASSASNSLSAVVDGLTNGTSYTFVARAVNSVGAGAASNEASATPAATVPGAASDLAATAGSRQVTLSASVSDTGGSAVTRWEYRYKETTGGSYPDDWTQVASSASNSLSVVVDGLTDGTSYTFVARAVNSVGAGAASNEASATPVSLTVPDASGDLAAAAGNGSVTLTATTASDGGSSVLRWEYRQRETSGGTYPDDWTQVPSSASTSLSTTVSSLTNGTSYTFVVRAVNSVGAGGDSVEASAVPATVPDQATILSASGGDSSVTLSANVADDGGSGVLDWQYRYAPKARDDKSFTDWITVSTAGSLMSASITGLTNATQYQFEARARNAVGYGAASSVSRATPRAGLAPPKATGFTATAVSGVTARVRLAASVPSGTVVSRWEYRFSTTDTNTPWRTVGGAATTNLSVTLGSLEGIELGKAYKFWVRAANTIGAAPESDPAAVTLASSAPPQPTASAQPGDGSVTLSASVASGTVVHTWQHRHRTPASGSSSVGAQSTWSGWVDVVSTATSLVHVVSNLTNGATYDFEVRALNNSATPGATRQILGVALSARAPGAVSDLSAAKVSAAECRSVRLTASVSDTGGAAITAWRFVHAAVGASYPGTWTQVSAQSNGSLSHTVSGLAAGTTHKFKVRAVNSVAAGGESNEATAATGAVPAAAVLSSVTAGTGSASLTATLSDDGGCSVTRWEYAYKIGAGEWRAWQAVAGTADAASLSHSVGGLSGGVEHTFRVRAVNAAGEGPASSEVAVTPASAPTTSPGTQAPTDGSPGGGGGGSGRAANQRLSGADRYATAAAVANKLVELLEAADPATGVRRQVDTVIIASGQSFPDALTASALSRVLRAPVLLTSKNRLEAPVRSFITRHRPATAVIVGGPAAVSADVEAALAAMSEIATVVRHAGADRYATAAKVAEAVGAPQRLCGTAKPTVIVTTGRNYPDALVAGPLAYRGRHPILLTEPGALPAPTRDWLAGSAAAHAVVIGGQKAVSDAVLDELRALGLTVERLSGTDRADTSAKVARKLISLVCANDRFRKDAVGLATGWAFPDALAAAPLLGHYGAPLLLTSPTGVPQPLIDYFAAGLLEPDFDLPPITIIGGRTAVPTAHQTKLLANLPR